MNKTKQEVDAFFDHLFSFEGSLPWPQLLLSIPHLWIERGLERSSSFFLKIGAQNCSCHDEGAYTGEISAKMIASAGAHFCLVGHSERRTFFHETLKEIHEKISLLLLHKVTPVLCVGESKKEKEEGREKEVIEAQILTAIKGLSLAEVEKIIFAYEPVWSIGTGDIPDPRLVCEMHRYCKRVIQDSVGHELINPPVLYGGSVKPDNVQDFLMQENVEGVLIGGASLSPSQFIDIILKGTNL